MRNIKTKDVLIYASMPRIVPRVKNLFSSGFAYVSFWMAQIYFVVRLLPANHPYLSSVNIGRFGVRHVITEASRNLTFSRKNIDQILVYFGMLTGVVMLVAQFLILIYVLAVSPAMAFSWFDTPDPASDIAYNLLDRVFGVPGVFCSTTTIANCTNFSAGVAFETVGPATGASILPLPFQTALHQLFRFYSTALLLVAVLIFLYFLVVIVFETATSGTPFGQRFQNVWVPIRLVVALGLLVPAPVAGVGATLNSGQYIVLYAAKYGSSFATVGWNSFNDAVVGHSQFSGSPSRPMGQRYSLLAIPEVPDISALVEAMSIVHACAYSYARLNAGQRIGTTASPTYPPIEASHVGPTSETGMQVVPFLVKHKATRPPNGAIAGNTNFQGNDALRQQVVYGGSAATPDYLAALGFYYGSDIIIRFGEYRAGDVQHDGEPGLVKPLCGDIRIPVASLADLGGAGAGRGGADFMLRGYYNLVMEMWFADLDMRQFARSYIVTTMEHDPAVVRAFCTTNESPGTGSLSGVTRTLLGFPVDLPACLAKTSPSATWKQQVIARYSNDLKDLVRTAWGDHVLFSTAADQNATDRSYGWIGAGVFYSKLAETNGGWIDGVQGVPYMDLYPLAMEQVRKQNRKSNEHVEYKRQFTMSTKAPGKDAPEGFSSMVEPHEVALGLSAVFGYWNDDAKSFDALSRISYQNIFMDSINRLFGTSGLAAMRTSNAHLNPIVQLVVVGKGLVDSAVVNLAGSTGAAFLGGMVTAMDKANKVGAISTAASQVLLSTAFMGLTAGFVLFYILPFLPFVYFYFAAASWIKAIFEAMVGVPLWALAHLRIDGDGLPGDSAQNGYFLILEIFIRPILTVVGLVAAVVIFSTQVQILNLIWDLVTSNISGDSSSVTQDVLNMTSVNDVRFQRGVIDQFFFTVIYTIVCYMMALASFKLIDRIPDNILRWAGAGVSSFGDINQDQVDSLSRYAAIGGMTMGNQAAGAITKLGGGLGQVVGGQLKGVTKDSSGKVTGAQNGVANPANE